MGRILWMISIIYDSGEFNITNLESFIYLKNITDLKWFVKKIVKIANNKDEVKDILISDVNELIYYYETKKSDKTNLTESECKKWIKKAKRLIEELEKI